MRIEEGCGVKKIRDGVKKNGMAVLLYCYMAKLCCKIKQKINCILKISITLVKKSLFIC
jgi:hypothetical protein